MKWEILNKGKPKDIVAALLKNRNLKTKKEREEFFKPEKPENISLTEFGINQKEVRKAVQRIKKAKKTGEKVFVYGDYDADGICGTAILWEALFKLGLNVLPYIPERFSEGYGLNIESLKKLKKDNPDLGLILTVDHGIVAGKKIDIAKELGVDVIVSDHHQKGKIAPQALAIIHTDKISGAAVAWVLARELGEMGGLELAAVGTIADQLPLIGLNRSLVKFGLEDLNKTQRPGLLALINRAKIKEVGTYEINYIIAPRINAMGRLNHGLSSLQLLCTRKKERAEKLAKLLEETNFERQKVVDDVVNDARIKVGAEKIIILSGEKYHEGVIGLAAGKLVEEFYRPVIVFSKKKDISKASARSITGFNIIENIRKLESLYLEGGGHPMAAGFSIETKNIGIFAEKLKKLAEPLLTEEILSRKLRIDTKLDFKQINFKLVETIKEFEPFGLGNSSPLFLTGKVTVTDARTVGREGTHLKLKLEKNKITLDAIAFGMAVKHPLKAGDQIDLVYSVEENIWNDRKTLQLKVKDYKLN